ncbi:hypothetical protein Q3C01_17425 [Bradyrhizobium sp. UFLA05-109]
MLAELSPTQEQQWAALFMALVSWLGASGAAASITTFLTKFQHLDQHLAPMLFVGILLVAFSVGLMIVENRSLGLHAANAKVSKLVSLRFRSLASACMITGLLILLMAFITWTYILMHQPMPPH